jgi:hypothetical protein
MSGLIDQYGSALLFTGTFVIAYIVLRKVKSAGAQHGSLTLPPTLPTVPILGSVFHLPTFAKFHSGLLEKKKTLGGIFGFYLGSRFVVTAFDTHCFDIRQLLALFRKILFCNS